MEKMGSGHYADTKYSDLKVTTEVSWCVLVIMTITFNGYFLILIHWKTQNKNMLWSLQKAQLLV